MNAGFQVWDWLIFAVYAIVVVGLGLWISRPKKGEEKDSQDYFLAGRTLPWWAIGASLIAANISAEQFIGMSGSGFRIGIGIAAYEWIAALTLIIVAKYLLPIMIDKKIYTMPQLLDERYNKGVSLAFSIFWLLIYLFVNLTSVAWLGALAMEQVLGIPVMWGVVGLFVFAGIYSIYGGLKSVAWTDVIQVVFLVCGGLITAYFAIKAADPNTMNVIDGSFVEGIKNVFNSVKSNGLVEPGQVDRHLNMVVPDNTIVTDAATGKSFNVFMDLPGLALIFGAIWITNLGYWGFNQYIIQKGLAAKNLHEAKKGLIFAGYLKLLIPVIVVIPGITAYVLFNNQDMLAAGLNGEITKADDAYPWLLSNFAPVGIKGVAFAALVAAIVSSLASMLNSTSTIFTMDIYKKYINIGASEKKLVNVGRITALIALAIALVAVKPLLGGLDQAFQYIQEYTGYIYPGVCVVFTMALIWKKATNKAALWTAIATIPVGVAFKFMFPDMGFLLRNGYVFIVLVLIAIIISELDKSHRVKDDSEIRLKDKGALKASYILGALTVICIVLGLIFSKPLKDYAFEAIFTMAAMLGFIAYILYTNTKSPMKDEKAYENSNDLFKFNGGLVLGALGIVVIMIVTYAIFW
ncbi:MAG: sodium/sugar symporter [Tidjanibacter sp.]|nr:sodium/sugar symporter [Tidjanibacter sp.]